uniref:40S ribosomal protein SA n=1 Tax=Mustela putorius furo TaxID=9669 RepID=M3XPZ8_MUSPF
MSRIFDVLQMKEDGVLKFLAAGIHSGGTNLTSKRNYIYKRKSDGIFSINLENLGVASVGSSGHCCHRNPTDVRVMTFRNTGQRVVRKFAAILGPPTMAGRFTSRAFINQIQGVFQEQRLLVVTAARADHWPLTDVSGVDLPTTAMVEQPICCTCKGAHSVGLMWRVPPRELRMRGTRSWVQLEEVLPDLSFHRDSEEIRAEPTAAEKAVTTEEFQSERTAPAPGFTTPQPEVTDRSEGMRVTSVPCQQIPAQ